MASIGKPFFLVKLSCPVTNLTTSVVVQDEQFMFWHNFLQVGEQYVFYKLRETTMNKGTRNERKVLATSRHSDLRKYQPGITMTVSKSAKRPLEDEQGKSKRPRIAQEQDDLNHTIMNENAEMKSGDTLVNREILQPPRPRPPVSMSYMGVITNCIKPEAGLFELDNKIRLYISHQPSPNLGRGLRVGAHVTIHNVHLCKKGKKTLGLCCCTQSTVRVVKFSPLASPWKPFSPCVSPLALLAQNLTLADYVDLLEMCEKVLEKFSHLYRTSQLVSYSSKQNRHLKKESVLELLLSFVKRTSAATSVHSRNIYDEFFEVPHECHPNRASVLTFLWLPTIKEFLDSVNQKSADKPWLSGLSSNTTTATQEKEDWVYKVMSQECLGRPVILIGCLRSSSKTGQLKLLDQTGEITCMIAAADQQATEHDCATDCCRKLSVDSKCPSCPFAQTWHTDAMIQINKFEVVMENFQSRNLVHEDFAENKNRIYLQFSFDNAEILISKDTCRKPDCDGQMKCSATGEEKSKNHAKDEGANASLDKASNGFMCKIIFIVRNCEVATLRRVKEELCYPCGVEIKVVAVYRNETQKAAENKGLTSERTCSCSLNNSTFLSGFKLQRKTVALKLVKRSLCWSQFLHPGCFYVITETVANENCSRVLQDGNIQSLINVSSDMLLERICWCQNCGLASLKDAENNTEIVQAFDGLKDDFLKNDSLDTVDTVLSNASCKKDGGDKSLKTSSSSLQVSFRGLIVNRELRQSDTPSQRLPNELVEVPKFGPVKISVIKGLQLGFTLLNNTIIQLRVRDLQSPNVISVYLDLRRITYICGILPGAIVQFRRLVRKFSRSRNMYCTFEACSSVVVERRAITNLTDIQPNPQSSALVTASTSGEEITKKLPNRRLIELIESEAQGKFVQTISCVSCRVTAVQKASLRWLCKRCEELVTRNECTAGCFSSKGYKLHAEVRCVVEDGTGEAQLYVYDDMVPTVLKLSSQQWRHLQDLAMRTGELLYQRHRWFGGDRKLNQGNLSSKEAEAKMILENHCCSSQVKRRVLLECKLFRFNKTTGSGTKQGYESRSITVGSTEHTTLVLPKLLLRAVSITEVRTVDEIRRLLPEVKDGDTK
ncbi:CST complex subunit CTC1-like isoform X2 [Oculina patagonica]